MSADKAVLFLPDAELENLGIQPTDVADAIESALIAKAEGRLHASPKTAIMPGDGRYMMSTLAVGGDGFIVVKQVSVCPGNAGRDLPAINGAIMVLDAETGLLRAVLGANWITAIRTAALSAVAARRLADPASQNLTFVGAGVQAHSHLEAFAQMFPLKRIRILSRGKANAELLSQSAIKRGLDVEVSGTPDEALRGADLVVSSVTMDFTIEPFLDARLLGPNAFAAITDACIPWLPDSMTAFQSVIVDDRLQEQESANPMLPYDQIAGDLTELVSGTTDLNLAQGPRAFAFRGISLGDYAAAVLAVNKARSSGAGNSVPFG